MSEGAATDTTARPASGETADPGRLADRAAGAVLADLGSGRHRGVVVDSPPGAGKSALVVRAATELADAGERVMVVAQTNEQVDDLTDRLAADRPALPLARLSAQDYVPSRRVARHHQVTVSAQAHDVAGYPVVLSTAAKWATVGGDRVWPWAIVDEAYQMRSDLLLRVAGLFGRALFVGDPGQLDPFSTVQTGRWLGLTWDPMQSAVAVLLRHNPDLPVHQLPVSWRLPEPAAAVVSEAFYPFTGFRAGSTPQQRRLELTTRAFGGSPFDEAVETAAASGWALYELPGRHTVRTDAEAVTACAALAARILQRGAVSYSGPAVDAAPVTAGRIAIGTAHRDQAKAVRAVLEAEGLGGVTADTANRLQGREFDVVIVLHPLSGRRDATAFHLEAGRLCVLTSRHRHACLVVARAGIPELLDAHPSTEPVHLNVPVKFPDGWAANQAVMARLQQWKVRAP
ncbi:MAG TPA: AAA domain-containing protein [Streptosporangiaceae bacterium]|nr:AAA domain-containing protein [Streptosporangiaceae bacterium]